MGTSCSACVESDENRKKDKLEKKKFLLRVSAKSRSASYDSSESDSLMPPFKPTQSADSAHIRSSDELLPKAVAMPGWDRSASCGANVHNGRSGWKLWNTSPGPPGDVSLRPFNFDALSLQPRLSVATLTPHDRTIVRSYMDCHVEGVSKIRNIYNTILSYYQLPENVSPNYNDTRTQIQILSDRTAKRKSLTLCKEMLVNKTHSKRFGFWLYLYRHLETKTIAQLFGKFPNTQSLDAAQFVAVLTLTCIMYKIRLHQLISGNKRDKPELNVAELKICVEYLAMWCVRKYGEKRDAEFVSVRDCKNGHQINGEFDGLNFSISRIRYGDLYRWVRAFIEHKGRVEW